MIRIIIAALVILAVCRPVWGDQKTQAWIVLSFKLTNEAPGEMAFNNPAVPDITLDECKAELTNTVPYLISAAIARQPMLKDAKFENAYCVLSVQDPIKPQ